MNAITKIQAREILDSRKKPTIEVTVSAGEYSGTYSVPSGASTGSTEAFVLRDSDGHMKEACARVEEISEALIGMDVSDQKSLDDALCALDGTSLKSHLGGNVLLGVSIAAARCAAAVAGVELFEYLRSVRTITPSRATPLLYMNYINGGKHVDPSQTSLSIQEHMIVPQVDSVEEALTIARNIEMELATLVEARYGSEVSAHMGDEGGFVIPESAPDTPFRLLVEAIEKAGCTGTVQLAIDAAANSFYHEGVYALSPDESYTASELQARYEALAHEFPLISIEDPFAEDALDAFVALQETFEEQGIRVVGDDVTTTARSRIEDAARRCAIQAVIIKPNQIGTLSETLDAMEAARNAQIDCIVSHRSGETMDAFVADLAYAFGTFGLKAGTLRKPERAVKYERLRTLEQ